jgi:hypothetical protein
VGAEEKLGGKMDSMEPEQTPFAAVSAHTSRLTRVSLRLLLGVFESRERTGDGQALIMRSIAIPSLAG